MGSKIQTDEMISNKIAEIYASRWPNVPNQEDMAELVGTTQSRISIVMKKWKKKKKEDIPLTVTYRDSENSDNERKIKDNYELKKVTAFPFKKYLIKKTHYFEQICTYVADIIVSKINDIAEEKNRNNEHPLKIKITTSSGRSVSGSIMRVEKEIQNNDIDLEISGCNAIRSESLVGLSPLHMVAQLLDKKPNINVTKAYQLPKLSVELGSLFAEKHDRLKEIVEQRIMTHPRFEFDDNLLESDIALLGLGTAQPHNMPAVGFAKHIENEELGSLMEALGIQGEVGYAPFNKKGFLFHQLMEHVFNYSKERREFDNFDEESIRKGLQKCAEDPGKIEEKHVIQMINLFSSIFTLNFCNLNKGIIKRKKQNKNTPYVILLVGGKIQKAEPLMALLHYWKDNNINILDELVIGENIAEEVVKSIE